MTSQLNKPRIAVLIDWYLPGTKAGGPVRSVYSLVSVMKEDFDFYIITTNADLGETVPYKEIVPDELNKKNGVNYYYFSKENLSENSVLHLMEAIKPDLIYLNSFWSYNFSIRIVQLKIRCLLDAPILLAPRGMLGKGALGLKPVKKKGFLFVSKIMRWYKDIIFHATQPQEQHDIESKFKNNKIIVAPNVNSGQLVANRSSKAPGHLRLFYLSRISRVKNLHYALLCLREVPQEISVEYDIYGNLEDKEYWNECQEIISTLHSNVKVQYKKELAFHEVQSAISEYNCLFLPTLNENFGHSIVESLLCGCPVIISDQTPWTDLQEFGAGYSISLSNKQGFVDAIKHYGLMNEDDFLKASQNANNYISKKIDLPSIIQKYKTLFNACIKN